MQRTLIYVCAAMVTTVVLARPAGADESFNTGLASITFDVDWRSQHTSPGLAGGMPLATIGEMVAVRLATPCCMRSSGTL